MWNVIGQKRAGKKISEIIVPRHDWTLRSLSWLRLARVRVKTGDENRKNAGEEYAVERPGAADGSNRRAEAAHFVEVRQIGPDQRSKASGDIGEGRRVSPRQQESDGG